MYPPNQQTQLTMLPSLLPQQAQQVQAVQKPPPLAPPVQTSACQQNPQNATLPHSNPTSLMMTNPQLQLVVPSAVNSSDENSNRVAMAKSNMEYTIVPKCLAELLCVLIVVASGCIQKLHMPETDGILHSALTHGLAVCVVTITFYGVSGAHANPAITFACTVIGKMQVVEGVCYMISQFVGGFLGSFIVRGLCTRDNYTSIAAGAIMLPDNGVVWYQAFVGELIAATILVLVFLIVLTEADTPMAGSMAVGFTVIVDIMAIGSLSGGSMNPARSLGPNVAGTMIMSELPINFWKYHWIYIVSPFLGCLIAAAIYKGFFDRERRAIK